MSTRISSRWGSARPWRCRRAPGTGWPTWGTGRSRSSWRPRRRSTTTPRSPARTLLVHPLEDHGLLGAGLCGALHGRPQRLVRLGLEDLRQSVVAREEDLRAHLFAGAHAGAALVVDAHFQLAAHGRSLHRTSFRPPLLRQ